MVSIESRYIYVFDNTPYVGNFRTIEDLLFYQRHRIR